MISALLATAALPSRFQLVAPLALPPVRVDTRMAKYGVAQEMAAQQNLQARMLWIDATANLDRVNSAEKIDTLVNKIADAGFNTVVYEVKPIVGRTSKSPSPTFNLLLFCFNKSCKSFAVCVTA